MTPSPPRPVGYGAAVLLCLVAIFAGAQAGVSPAAAAGTETNLLMDGGFEAGGVGWHTYPVGGGIVNIANYQNAGAHDGARYQESNTSTDAGSIYQDVPVTMTTGQSATFSIWARLPPGVPATGQSVNLCLWALTSSPTNACHRQALTNTWQQLQATATMPAATGTLRAQLYMYGRGNIDFDGASLGAPQTASEYYVPQSTSAPSVTGSPSIGATLTCSPGGWSGDPTSLSYAWWDDGRAIPGAASPSYTITPANAGSTLACAVTATNPAGSATAASGAVAVPVATQLPTSHRRRALRVRIIVSWTWDRQWTRLTRIRVGRLPRHATITVTCRGRSCPRRAHEASARHLKSFRRALAGTRFHAGDRILIVIRAPGAAPERVEVFIHNGRLPTAKLL
jgi:hypothetical protein